MIGSFDIVVIGAGISGATIAERYANLLNKKVLVIEKRDHIGGNCYDYKDKNGILISKYGAHIFHTNYEDVWEYINLFSKWFRYEHKVLSKVDNMLVPVPVNITTVNKLFNLHIKDEKEMKNWLVKNVKKVKHPKNSEDSAISRVGYELYEKMFKNYTKKQWDLLPSELEASVMDRIPVHTSFDDRYFKDKYQVLPSNGYTEVFNKMLDHKNITVLLNTDYFKIKNDIKGNQKTYFTGPIDRYFNHKYDSLQYRSINFKFETHDLNFFQKNSVINYPQTEKFTRIVEYKHFYDIQSKKTVISKEFSKWGGEPYYPVPNEKNRQLFNLYKKESEVLENEGIYFVGRLANYKYFNMDQAFKNALDLFKKNNL